MGLMTAQEWQALGPVVSIESGPDCLVRCNVCGFQRRKSETTVRCPKDHVGGWSYAGPVGSEAAPEPAPAKKPGSPPSPVQGELF
jgi:hypothetical protein